MNPAPFAAEDHASTVLEVRQDGRLLHAVPVRKDSLVIGRRAGVDCRLEHETVSRLHAVIYREPGGPWRIRDLGSHNGTFVGPRRISQELLGPNASAGVGVFELRLVRTLARATPTAPQSDSATRTNDPQPTRTHHDPDDRTVSFIHAALESEVDDEYRTQLLELARRVRVLESPVARRRQLCEFLRRYPDLDVASAIVITGPRRARPEDFTVSAASPASDAGSPDAARLSAPLLSRVLDKWQPVRGSTNASDPDITMTSLGFSEASHVVACPLGLDNRDTAEVLLAAITSRDGHRPDDHAVRMIALAAKQYAAALEEAAALDLREEYRSYRDQLRVAEQLQRSLLPRSPDLPGLDVALVSAPSERVSGDYIDAFAIDQTRSLLFLADVTGHGLGAAIVAAQIHTMVHAHPWDEDTDLPTFVKRVSSYLCRFTPDHITVTALALLYDHADESLQLVNAGHHPVLICRPNADPRPTHAGANALLGLEQLLNEPVTTEPVPITHDTWIVGYSDGVPEQRDAAGSALGQHGATTIIAEAVNANAATGTAQDVARRIGLDLDRHQGVAQQSDDRSLFVLRAASPKEPNP